MNRLLLLLLLTACRPSSVEEPCEGLRREGADTIADPPFDAAAIARTPPPGSIETMGDGGIVWAPLLPGGGFGWGDHVLAHVEACLHRCAASRKGGAL